jgi:hypothetical protein
MTTPTTGAAELPEALPRYREYMHLRTTGAWSDGVPAWAKDYSGRMNDMTAAHAVIEELHARVEALSAAQAGVPSDAMVDAYLQAQRRAVEESDQFGRPNIGGLHTNTVREACRAGLKAALAAAPPTAQAAPAAVAVPSESEKAIRRLLCNVYAGPLAYMDDGEAQDSRALPCIDFMRDSAGEIRAKMQRRGLKNLSSAAPQPPVDVVRVCPECDIADCRHMRAAPAVAPAQAAQWDALARRLFDAGWKASARYCGRDDVVADGIIGFGACPQFEAEFAAALAKWGQPQAVAVGEPVDRVFIVATGEEHEGEATYTRYDHAPPPLCDSECLYTAPQPAVAAGWMPIETAPKHESVLLYSGGFTPIYCGRRRYGLLGEPQQDVLAWRCDSSGRFANPTHWAPLPPAPSSEGESNG